MAVINDKQVLFSPHIHITERYEEGFKDGQLNVLESAEVLKGTKSGSAISVNDVSVVEHNLNVRLTSDTITDFSDITVSRYGKNLFNLEPMLSAQNWRTDSALNIQGYWNYPITGLTPNTTYTISMKENGWQGVPNDDINVTLRNDVGIFSSAYSLCHRGGVASYCKSKVTQTSNENGVLYLSFYNPTDERLALFFSKCPEMILAVGSSAVSYEPYKEPQTATANAGGTVEGLTSLSPNMTLISNTDDVTINCEYYRDIDTYIDNLTTNIALTGGN